MVRKGRSRKPRSTSSWLGGVEQIVVFINKVDIADEELLELVQIETEEYLAAIRILLSYWAPPCGLYKSSETMDLMRLRAHAFAASLRLWMLTSLTRRETSSPRS